MIRKVFLFFAIIAGLAFSCKPQSISKHYTDTYNLHFSVRPDSSIKYPWMENAAYTGYNCIPYDFLLYSRMNIEGQGPLMAEFEQRILLPIHKERNGTVTLECRGENLKGVSILLDGLDREEKCFFSDTVTFVPDSSFSRISKVIPLFDIDMLNIRIHVQGKDREVAYIVLSKLDIMIGNKDINEYPLRKLSALSYDGSTEKIPLQSDAGDILTELDAMKEKKIIALGESIHGSSSVRHLAYKLIMDHIKKRNCKLVIWEMPMEMSLLYNRYVMEDKFILDSIEFLRFDGQRIKFLNELKQYNSRKQMKDKVKLLGMDYITAWDISQNSALVIGDFVASLNREFKLPEIDYLYILLADKDWNKAIEYLKEHKEKIRKVLTVDEIEYILHILSLSYNIGTDKAQRFISRDSVMFVNTTFLLNYHSKPQTIIYAHNVHINPVSTYPVVAHCDPFGKYMKEEYLDEYLPFLLLIGNGRASAYVLLQKVDKQLQVPPVGSLENFLNQKEDNIFYYPLTAQFNDIVLSRFKGDRHTIQEFYPYNLYQRYKGAFFIKDAFIFDNDKEKIDNIKYSIIKNKQRLNILENIKENIGTSTKK